MSLLPYDSMMGWQTYIYLLECAPVSISSLKFSFSHCFKTANEESSSLSRLVRSNPFGASVPEG